jgi:hypothetical protein
VVGVQVLRWDGIMFVVVIENLNSIIIEPC